MKTKFFTFLFAIVASIGSLFAEKVKIGDLYYNLNNEDQTAEVCCEKVDVIEYWGMIGTGENYVNLQGELVIPSSVEYKSKTYSVTSIGDYAFAGCQKLNSVSIPASVMHVGCRPFISCNNLPITDNIRYADSYLIEVTDQTQTNYTIKDGTKWIGDAAFLGCENITSISIPNSMLEIGDEAFKQCINLSSIKIPNLVTYIGQNAFDGCDNFPVIDNIRYADTYLIEVIDRKQTAYTIKDGTKWIGEMAFAWCNNTTSITIPSTIIGIGDEAFKSCKKLVNVLVDSKNTKYDSRNNCNAIIETATNTLVAGCLNSTIPNSVTSIGKYAFSGCYGLIVSIPNSVTSIGDYAFYDCEDLESINIPNSVISIGNNAFSRCFGLSAITIPSRVKSIGEYAFFQTGLTSVFIYSGETSIREGTFIECMRLESIYNYAYTPQKFEVGYNQMEYDSYFDRECKLYVPKESVELYKSAEVWKEFGDNILPISAAETDITSAIQAEPTANTAEIAWEKVDGAYTYELVIKDKEGNVICTFVFNAQGQLTQTAFNAPSRNQAPQQKQAAGFAFTVTGLDSGTKYDYTLTAKNSAGTTLKTETGSFTTTGPQSIDQVQTDQVQSTKVLREGKIFIERGNKVYTATGQEVK